MTAVKKLKKQKVKKAAKNGLAAVREKIRKRYELRPCLVYEHDSDKVPRTPTRFLKLNAILGGGVREGAIIEVYGMEDSGKSTTALALAADFQKKAPKGKGSVLLVNYERTFDYEWARTLGLDTTEDGDHPPFIHLEPHSLEEGVADALELIETGEVCCVIFDSVHAADSRDGREAIKAWNTAKGKGAGIAVEARKWGQAWTTLKSLFKDYGVVAIAVNQAREDLEMGGGKKGHGPPRLKSGRGSALKFYAWVRLEIRATNFNPEGLHGELGDDGRHVKIKVVKNKTSGTARGTVEYDLVRGEGFDLIEDLIEESLKAGVIKGGGGGFFEMGSKKIRGREKLHAMIVGSEAIQELLTRKVAARLANVDFEEEDREEEEAADEAMEGEEPQPEPEAAEPEDEGSEAEESE